MPRNLKITVWMTFVLACASLFAQQQPAPAKDGPHKLGSLNISINWRFRTEAWDFFQPAQGQNAYGFEHSLLKIGIGQRAEAFVGELGWQPSVRFINPWFSAGYSYGSGDSNAADNVHGTFFQIMPTPRPYDRFPFYNMMNNEDFYGSAVFRLPHALAVRSELHALRLASAKDLWYGGGGAFQSNTFGYTGRSSGGARSLANVWDASLDVPLRYGFSITTYYAYAWGKSVIANIFSGGPNGQFGYVETNFRF